MPEQPRIGVLEQSDIAQCLLHAIVDQGVVSDKGAERHEERGVEVEAVDIYPWPGASSNRRSATLNSYPPYGSRNGAAAE